MKTLTIPPTPLLYLPNTLPDTLNPSIPGTSQQFHALTRPYTFPFALIRPNTSIHEGSSGFHGRKGLRRVVTITYATQSYRSRFSVTF